MTLIKVNCITRMIIPKPFYSVRSYRGKSFVYMIIRLLLMIWNAISIKIVKLNSFNDIVIVCIYSWQCFLFNFPLNIIRRHLSFIYLPCSVWKKNWRIYVLKAYFKQCIKKMWQNIKFIFWTKSKEFALYAI